MLLTITESTHVQACVPLINICVHPDVYHFSWFALWFLLNQAREQVRAAAPQTRSTPRTSSRCRTSSAFLHNQSKNQSTFEVRQRELVRGVAVNAHSRAWKRYAQLSVFLRTFPHKQRTMDNFPGRTMFASGGRLISLWRPLALCPPSLPLPLSFRVCERVCECMRSCMRLCIHIRMHACMLGGDGIGTGICLLTWPTRYTQGGGSARPPWT